MSEIKLNDQSIRYISFFEKITKANVKDCIDKEDILFFIVEPGQLGKALGKSSGNVKKFRRIFNKNIDVIEFSLDIKKFIRNIFHEFQIKDISIEKKNAKNQDVAYITVDIKEKGKIIGRNSRNLKSAKDIINRYYPIDIIVV